MSAAECAIHFRWKGLAAGEILNHVEHIGVRDVPGTQSGVSNLVSSMLRDFVKQEVYDSIWKKRSE